MKDLLVVVPSRRRPGNIDRLWQAMSETCAGDVSLAVGLDDDDEQNYPRIPGVEYEVRVGLHYVTGWTNELAVPRAADYFAVGCLGDDNLPRTPGWDVRILAALEQTPFAFGNDLYPRAPGSLCCHVFMRSEVIQVLGYAGPPSIAHMYVDVVWYAWGTACGITYLDDVVIDHLHFTTGKSPQDATYNASQNLIPPDLQNWHQYSRGGGLNEDIRKLGGEPFTRQSLAEFNQRLFIPG